MPYSFTMNCFLTKNNIWSDIQMARNKLNNRQLHIKSTDCTQLLYVKFIEQHYYTTFQCFNELSHCIYTKAKLIFTSLKSLFIFYFIVNHIEVGFQFSQHHWGITSLLLMFASYCSSNLTQFGWLEDDA